MDEIYIDTHLLELIFNSIDPTKLLKLRVVHKTWSLIIDNSDVWKRLCSNKKLKPILHQLFKLRFPEKKSEEYKSLSKKDWRELFLLYVRWNVPFKDANHMIRSYFYLPYINDIDKIFSIYNRFDLLGDYLAYIICRTGQVNLLNIKTGKQLLRPIFLEVSNDQLELNCIQIWLTEDQKIILVIKWINQIFIFNAEDSRQYMTPPVFTNLDRDNQIVRRRRLADFFQLEFNNQDEIIAKEILRITQPITFRYEYEKIYHEKRKIMVVSNVIPTRVDETNLRKRFCRATIVRLPRLITKPINIDSRDKRYSITLVRKFDVNRFEIFCSDSKILLLSREEKYPDTLRLIWVKHSHSSKKLVRALKRFKIPRNIANESIYYVNIFLNFLFIVTRKGNFYAYKLENLNNLMYINLERLRKVEFSLKSHSLEKFFDPMMTQIDGEPRIIIPTNDLFISMIRIV